ncbi:diguanylate cyclase domain-containing protein [Aliikangiella coralliicola]|uniref:Diguanylate cyclase n=1 Tax=Aliikangiella coralliicola TaxID=2592383 RepID=A0A545U4J4_9GAMM|nr:diguanylate cyclase [Aliikangiella coralliicola]TQV84376.1 diguanylate cyclase [Aliikangiella coralliicola]
MTVKEIRPDILVVDDMRMNLVVLRSLLESFSANIVEATSGAEALHKAVGLKNLALILLDVQMPEMDGYEVAELLKDEEETESIPIIFVTAIHRDETQILKGYSYGAADYLTKPIVPEILLSKVGVFLDLWRLRSVLEQEVKMRTEAEIRLQHLAHHDELTGLPNRRELMDAFAKEINRSVRFEKRMVVLMIDLDGFKQVNDDLGHEAGDFTLVKVAARVSKIIRQYDTFARIGGDEFVILMSDIEGVIDIKNKVEEIITEISKPILFDSKPINIGASIGIASFPEDGTSIDEILSHADDAMYAAKKAGGNRLTYYK